MPALALLAGCSGHTTGASDIKLQPGGTYSAKLNAVGSCDHGSPTTPCTAYTRWRKVGTSAWTNGPTVTVPTKLSNVQRSQTATGLAPNTQYEYQVCGKEFAVKSVVCIGPDPTDTKSTQKFTTGGGSTAAGGKATKKRHAHASPGSRTAAPKLTNGGSSSSGGGGGGTSPLVPIAIAVGAGVLILGGTWWASRRLLWSRKDDPSVAAPWEASNVQRPQTATGHVTSTETPATEKLATEPTNAPPQESSGGERGTGTAPQSEYVPVAASSPQSTTTGLPERMTSLTGDFQIDLPVPDTLVACAEAIDGLGWDIETVEINRIVSYAKTGTPHPPKIEVVLNESEEGTDVRIIGTDSEAGPLPQDALIAELSRVRGAIQSSLEKAP